MIPSILFLRSNSPAGLVFWAVLGLCAGVYLFIRGFQLLQRRKLILDTPLSKIRSAALGMVELSGLAVGPYTMVAPITARACYYYRTVVWEYKQSGKNKQWVKVAAECMHLPFFLDDNTCKVLVDPRAADLDLHRDFQQEFCDSFFSTKQEAPPKVRDFLLRYGVSTRNKIKVEEFCIKPKNALFLLGTLAENPGITLTQQPIRDEEHNSLTLGSVGLNLGLQSPALSLGLDSDEIEHRSVSELLIGRLPARKPASARTPQVIRLSPEPVSTKTADMTQQQKVASALMKAGITNPAAWAAAGVTPAMAVVAPVASGNPQVSPEKSAPHTSTSDQSQPTLDGFDPHPPVVLMKGKNNPTFLISWRSQRELAKSLGRKCTLMIWGGPVIALLSLYGLLSLLHWL